MRTSENVPQRPRKRRRRQCPGLSPSAEMSAAVARCAWAPPCPFGLSLSSRPVVAAGPLLVPSALPVPARGRSGCASPHDGNALIPSLHSSGPAWRAARTTDQRHFRAKSLSGNREYKAHAAATLGTPLSIFVDVFVPQATRLWARPSPGARPMRPRLPDVGGRRINFILRLVCVHQWLQASSGHRWSRNYLRLGCRGPSHPGCVQRACVTEDAETVRRCESPWASWPLLPAASHGSPTASASASARTRRASLALQRGHAR